MSPMTPTNCTILSQQRTHKRKYKKGDELAIRFFEHHEGWETSSRLDPGKSEIYSYLSVWKCANNQIHNIEIQTFGEKTTTSFQKRWGTFGGKEYRPEHFGKEDRLSECIVAVVRDPISHFLSGYNEVEWRIHFEFPNAREPIAAKWPFGSNKTTRPPGSIERFEQFVADFVSCPIGKELPGIYEKYPNSLELEHLYSMSGILRLLDKDPVLAQTKKNNGINFHYLPSLANINELWGPFVLFSCPKAFSNETRANFAQEIETDAGHESSDDPLGTYKAAKMAMKKEGPTAKALCALHLMDYACWQDLPDGVPRVCMDLYLDYYRRGLLR